jgi:hypothetical protein
MWLEVQDGTFEQVIVVATVHATAPIEHTNGSDQCNWRSTAFVSQRSVVSASELCRWLYHVHLVMVVLSARHV